MCIFECVCVRAHTLKNVHVPGLTIYNCQVSFGRIEIYACMYCAYIIN